MTKSRFDIDGIANLAHAAGIHFGGDINLHTLWRFADLIDKSCREEFRMELERFCHENLRIDWIDK